MASALQPLIQTLFRHYGPQNWWPAQSRFEVIVGAYLVQNTNWSNAERAIGLLRKAGALNIPAIREIPVPKLERLIRSSGYYRQKAQRLKTFIRYLDQTYSGSLNKMFAQNTERLRSELLKLNGVGPETADSILLYAGGHPVFVVDAYTRRILHRHNVIPNALTAKYDNIRRLFESVTRQFETATGSVVATPNAAEPRHAPTRMSRAHRSKPAQLYNELHAMIVRVGSTHCRSTAKCEDCPLHGLLKKGGDHYRHVAASARCFDRKCLQPQATFSADLATKFGIGLFGTVAKS